MDSSRALLALDELAKWKERKRRVEERLHKVRSRKQFLVRELTKVQAKISELGVVLVQMRVREGPVVTSPLPSPPLGVIR